MKHSAKKLIKKILLEEELSYVKLAELMKKNGYKETPDTIRSKIHRGAYNITFLLAVCDTLNYELITEKNLI